MYVKVEGVAGSLKALNKVEPEIAKGVGRELNKAGRKIRDDARRLTPTDSPMRNWRTTPARNPRGKQNAAGLFGYGVSRGGQGWPAWNKGGFQKSIRSKRREFLLEISANDASAMIYELAGTKGGFGRGSAGSPQGQAFIAKLPAVNQSSKGDRTGRIMVPALKKNYKATREAIEKAVDRTRAELQKAIG